MENSKRGLLPLKQGIHLSKEQSPKTPEEKELMSKKPYASAVGSLMYAMICTRPDICYAVGVVSRYQSDPGVELTHPHPLLAVGVLATPQKYPAVTSND